MPNFLDKLITFFSGPKQPAPPPAGRDPDATVPLPDLPTSRPVVMPKVNSEIPPHRLLLGVAQDVGRVRNHNEDVLLYFTGELKGLESIPNFGLYVVADGMGGHSLGERASSVAARTLARVALEKILPSLLADPHSDPDRPSLTEVMGDAMEAANRAVNATVPEGGTTLTCALTIGEHVVLSHVGDSRAYIITDDSFEQVTRDHSLVQRLVELGQLSPDEAAAHQQKNVLYKAIGQGDGLEVDLDSRRLSPGTMLLLCSDGLWGYVPDERMLEIIRQSASPQEACETLVAAANAAGGPDNITALIVKLPR
ncbi:MAG: PP2C family protein-serine/threonine phosphatase [Anaerolineales bacterium]